MVTKVRSRAWFSVRMQGWFDGSGQRRCCYTSFADDSGTTTLTATLVPGSSGGLPIVTGTSSVTINFSGCPSLCVGTVA